MPAKLARRAEGLRPLSLLGSRFVQLEGKKTAASLLVTLHIPHALDGLRREPEAQRQIIAFAAAHGVARQTGDPRAAIAQIICGWAVAHVYLLM